MNSKIIGIIAGFLVLSTGSIAFLGMKPTSPLNQANPATQTTQDAPIEQPAPDHPAGKYVDYTADSIENTTGTKILFFYAPWCPQCRALETSIKAGQIPDGVTIFKLDYDSNQTLRQKYGVTIQTTLVKVDDQGNLIEKYVAYSTPDLQSIIDNLL